MYFTPTKPEIPQLLLAVNKPSGTKHVVFKVKKWDPTLHPKGYKGLFIETPDKVKASQLSPGDVAVSKNGKTFKVEKQTAKGVKVNPVDNDTGEVKESYTVLGNDTDLAVVEAAKAVGSSHAVSDVEPGTFVQTNKGKKFVVSKHGKWTTVYPVNAAGKKSGKHTVLPPGTKVTIVAPDETADPAAAQVMEALSETMKEIQQADAFDVFANDLATEAFYGTLAEHMESWIKPGSLLAKSTDGGKAWIQTMLSETQPKTADEMLSYMSGAVPFAGSGWTMFAYDEVEVGDAWMHTKINTQKDFAPHVHEPAPQWDIWSDDLALEAFRTKLAQKVGDVLQMEDEEVNSSIAEIFHPSMGAMPDYKPDKYIVAEFFKDDWAEFIQQFHDPSEGSPPSYPEGELLEAWDEAWTETEHEWTPKVESKPSAASQQVNPATITDLEIIATDEFRERYGLWIAKKSPAIYDDGELASGMIQNLNDEAETHPPSDHKERFILYATNWEIYEPDADQAFKDLVEEMRQEKVAKLNAQVQLKTEAQAVEEILPTKLPKVPKRYPPGAGKGTYIEVTNATTYQAGDTTFKIERVSPDGSRQTIGTASSKTAAYRVARQGSAAHEEIKHIERTAKNDLNNMGWKAGDLVINRSGRVHKVIGTEMKESPYGQPRLHLRVVDVAQGSHPDWAADDTATLVDPRTYGYVPLPDHVDLKLVEQGYSPDYFTIEIPPGSTLSMELVRFRDQAGLISIKSDVVRKARPEKYLPQLQSDWEMDTLTGKTVNEALKTLNKLGYREIKPRQKEYVRVINANGNRITLNRSGNTITEVTSLKLNLGADTTARALYDQLVANFEADGDPHGLDPFDESVPLPMRTSHVQQAIFDMAIGKHNKVDEKIGKRQGKVKSDAEYLAELEEAGDAPSLEDTKASMQPSPLQIKARGAIIEHFGLKDDPSWNFDHRLLTVPKDMELSEQTAMQAIVIRQGMFGLVTDAGGKGDPKLDANNMARVEVGDTIWKPDSETGEGWFPHVVEHVYKDDVGNTTGIEIPAGMYKQEDNTGGSWIRPYNPNETNALYESARLLAQAYNQDPTGTPFASLNVDDATREYALQMMGEAETAINTAKVAADEDLTKRADSIRTHAIQTEIDKRREAEGTIKEANQVFDLPVWDEIEMEPQTFEDIHSEIAVLEGKTSDDPDPQVGDVYNDLHGQGLYRIDVINDDGTFFVQQLSTSVGNNDWTGDHYELPGGGQTVSPDDLGKRQHRPPLSAKIAADVPAFYTGGYIQDGLMYHRSQETHAKVSFEADSTVMETLIQEGAIEGGVIDPINPGYQGSGKLYDGVSLQLDEAKSNEDAPEPEGFGVMDVAGVKEMDSETEKRARAALAEAYSNSGGQVATTIISMNAIVGTHPETYEAEIQSFFTKMFGQEKAQRVWDQTIGVPETLGRSIEYIHHSQASGQAGGAPTSQRGRLILRGFTPEEAHERLKELGLVGEMEPEVPFKAILRGTRRHGALTPMHPAYMRGEAELPTAPAKITHGVTGGYGAEAVNSLKMILDSGGLLSIAERHRQGIKVTTVSPSGDIRSGLDHAVFCTLNGGGACGSGAHVKFVMKPSAFLRRDIVMAPNDFGGAETRYPAYRNYLNGLQTAAGEPKTNLYEPISPKTRQQHLNKVNTSSSNEFNLGPSIPIEDMESIVVPPESHAEINKKLDDMLAAGQIASRPKVITTTEFSAAHSMANVT